ncbi:WD40/YVTN repeat-like-containing domain [Cinara cedri]|uniref:WD40/YVTN repeat-like-containing domain n=1 Tax=Cinara cedri TaxID=506608 RepID=A0A5E4N6S9_9HEMI|nr:WD40/YVTN repeat-like-containing domain [Cinara cedri]
MNVLDYDVCAFSMDGKYVAAAVSNRFIIKKSSFAGIYITALADHAVNYLQWNSTSDFILCGQFGKSVLQVYDLCSKTWTSSFKCGYFKFIAVEWIGRMKILLTLEFHMALAIFDILKNSIVYVEVPKPIWPCVVFDNDGIHMFVVSKINGYEKILKMHSHNVDRIIYVQDIIGSCNGLHKSPDNQYLCVFNEKKLAVLNFLSGNVIGLIEFSILLNTVTWAPNGEYLALGCYLGNIFILESSNEFNVLHKLCHSRKENYDFFIESDRVLIKTKPSTNFINNIPKKIASIAWSFDCTYLSTFEINSAYLFIWKKYKLICVVEFSKEIKEMQWCQSKNKLSVVYDTDLIFFWTEKQIPKLQTSPKLTDGTCLLVSSISWSFNNKDMILSDGKKCLLFTT